MNPNQNGEKKTILLIGETGSGKSSFGNLILGREEFNVSDEEESCTERTSIKMSSIYPSIEVIDTPGLLDTHGNDETNTEQMIAYIRDLNENRKKNLHLILIILNFYCKRLNIEIQNMVKFLCNIFPINLSHHIGIVFTRYVHNDEMRRKRANNNPKQIAQEKFVPKLMSIISAINGDTFLNAPTFFLDSYEDDVNTKEEIKRLIMFTRTLPPIEIVRRTDNFNSKYKEIVDTFETETLEEKEGDRTVVIERKYKKKRYTDYNGNVTFGERVFFSEIKNFKEKVLPKIDEKRITEYIKDLLEGGFHIYQGMKFANEVNKEQNYSLNGWEKVAYALIGASISQNTLKEQINSNKNNK